MRGWTVLWLGSRLAHGYQILERAEVVLRAPDPRPSLAKPLRFDKLVRSRIPERIRMRGELPLVRELPQSERKARLKQKLIEESHEVFQAVDADEVLVELADALEVLMAIGRAEALDWTQVDDARRQKLDLRGGFDEGTFLVGTRDVAGQRDSSPTRDFVSVGAAGDRIQLELIPPVEPVTRDVTLRLGRLSTQLRVSYRSDGVTIRLLEATPESMQESLLGHDDESHPRTSPAIGRMWSGAPAPFDVVRQAILDICADGPIDGRALASALNRSWHTMRSRYLPPLLMDGSVRRLPDRRIALGTRASTTDE